MGYVSEDDFLYVLGRFKSLLIASDGEKYSPEGMEEAIVDKSPFIDQIIIYNNQSPFTGAIVVPNRDALRRELDARDIREGRAGPAAPMPENFPSGGFRRDWLSWTSHSPSKTD